jgi:hypothetical protein
MSVLYNTVNVKNASVPQVSVSFIPVIVSVTFHYFQFCTINSAFLRLISSKFYDPRTDTIEGRVPSLMTHK